MVCVEKVDGRDTREVIKITQNSATQSFRPFLNARMCIHTHAHTAVGGIITHDVSSSLFHLGHRECVLEGLGLRTVDQDAWVLLGASPLTSCVSLGQLLNLFVL